MKTDKKPESKVLKILTIIGVYSVLALIVFNALFFLVTTFVAWWDSDYFVFELLLFIISWVMAFLTIPIFILFPLKKHKLNTACLVLLIIFIQEDSFIVI